MGIYRRCLEVCFRRTRLQRCCRWRLRGLRPWRRRPSAVGALTLTLTTLTLTRQPRMRQDNGVCRATRPRRALTMLQCWQRVQTARRHRDLSPAPATTWTATNNHQMAAPVCRFSILVLVVFPISCSSVTTFSGVDLLTSENLVTRRQCGPYRKLAAVLFSMYPVKLRRKTLHFGTFCLRFNGHYPVGPGLAGTRISPFWIISHSRT